jgi:hypothetical protein
MTPPKIAFTEEEKALVKYLKEKLAARGIEKFPRDFHLKQLTIARNMLAGDNAPTVEEWQKCIDWCFKEPFWKDKVDHLARVETLWSKYCLQGGRKAAKQDDKYHILYLS